jgi:DNA mismatch repair protein MutS
MRQYLTAKEQHPDALLFFRLGDFYELFFEDAVVAARELELTLTSRNKNAADQIPMAGVPYHAASGYIQRLLERGFKVALCEQMADPSKVRGIVPREVVRVATPGIVFDDAGLDARRSHYLVVVESDGTSFGVAALDASTGELLACEADVATVAAEVVRLDPAEVLAVEQAAPALATLRTARPRTSIRPLVPTTDIAARGTIEALLGAGEATRSGAGPIALRAAAQALEYARACEAGRAPAVSRLVTYVPSDTLLLDESTQAHLELVRTLGGEERGSLLGEIDRTVTAGGARLVRRRLLAPKTNVAEIRRRLDAVELFVTQPGLRRELRERLGAIRDLERLATKAIVGRALPRDLAALRDSLLALPPIDDALAACPDPSAAEALGATDGTFLDRCSPLADALRTRIVDEPALRLGEGHVVREGFDPALDEARLLERDGQRLMLELEARLREETNIHSLKLRFTRVFGWYIEVTRSHLAKTPPTWRRKQTIATGERYTTDELDALADKVAHAEERASAREAELFAETVKAVAAEAERLRGIAERLAELDVASALAELAHQGDYARPEVDDGLRIEIEDGRHPVVERLAAEGKFVPNDVVLDASPTADVGRLWLVTGPNMAGKSTLMRQVALIVVLAQMGSFVPARRARIGIVDRVLTRVGASDNLSRGESTFMVEMKETANVLRRATHRSLVVLDEIGRGTSTYDGLAIAWAVAEHIHDALKCRALFATHYHELTELARTHSQAENWSVSAREHDGDVVFFHKLQRGPASRSYGVAVARIAGLPEPVLARARALLVDLERGAPLPTGAKASVRARAAGPQLDLWGAPAAATAPHPVLETLKQVDMNRMTPLEALTLLASLQKQIDPK